MMCPYLPRTWRPWLFAAAFLVAGVLLGLQAPQERTLGAGIRAVYLHGAWVWAGLFGFLVAGVLGVVGLWKREPARLYASRLWAWVGLAFWLTALPLSLWAMQVNWNGLFLMEPRWRMAWTFGVAGLLLQVGLLFLPLPWSGAVNALFAAALAVALVRTPLVLHPPMPVFRATSWQFPLHFLLTFLSLALAQEQLVRALREKWPPPASSPAGS